jgi:tRNA dimethylallyltransferase
MMAAGLVDEVRGLLAMGYSPGLPSMSGIGYREVCQHLAGEIDLAAAVARIKTATHRLARQQATWFRWDAPRIRWLAAGEGAVGEAVEAMSGFLGLGQGDHVMAKGGGL